MNKKILSFIYDSKKKKWLLLKTNDIDKEKHGPSVWFTVTGSLEGKESYERAVKREVFEETSLSVERIFSLNCGSKYNWGE